MGLITKLFGTYSERELKSIYPIVDKIEAMADEYRALTDEELRKAAATWQVRAGSRSGRTARQFVDALACKTQTEGK